MNFALDTNRYVDFMRGDVDVATRFRLAHTIAVPFVVLGELRAGFARARESRANERTLVRFLGHERVRVLWADEATAHFYARVFAQLRASGRPIPTGDLWIAALAMQHDLPLYTRDAHFGAVAGLATV
ncbi:MAG: type II toxin-antitoxin system VapC family toxin [Planctomycetota bacterium]